MNNASKSINANEELRDLVAAMPIVIFIRALRAAFKRPASVGAALLTASN